MGESLLGKLLEYVIRPGAMLLDYVGPFWGQQMPFQIRDFLEYANWGRATVQALRP